MGRIGRVERALLVLASLGVSLGMAEVAVRLAAPQDRLLVRPYLRPDEELGSAFKSNQVYFDRHQEPIYTYHVRTNNHGYRMDEDVNPSPAVRKVLALGDSFTFGWGVEIEDAFFSLLKKRIEARYAGVQVLNTGREGFSTGHVFKKLRRESDRYQVCAAVYFMNWTDLVDNVNQDPNYRVTSFRRAAQGAIVLTDEKAFSPFKRFLLIHLPGYDWLNQHSQFFVLIKRFLRTRAEAVVPFGPAEQVSGADPELMTDVALAHLERIAALARGKNLQVMVVWLPGFIELFTPQNGLNGVLAGFKSRASKSSGLRLFDPTPVLADAIRGRYQPDDLFFRDNYSSFGHYNKTGHAMFAAAVAEAVGRFVGESVAECGK